MLFNNTEMKVDLTMNEKIIELHEVTVKSSGIKKQGDTTTYFTNYYKTGQEKNVRDILEKLPGINIDRNTNAITANGKSVSKILVEKQDLFQGNTSTPMENLGAEGINSVNVIDNYSEYNILDGFKTSNQTVINLNVNGKMKGRLSGQGDIQGGVKSKYFIKNSSLLIGKHAMISGIASANNSGESVLRSKDIIGMSGGYSELLSNEDPQAAMIKTLSTYSSFIDNRKNVYKRDNGIVSLNTVIMPSEKIKVLWNGMIGFDRYHLRSNDHYEYTGNHISYDNMTHELQKKTHLLTNMKLSFMPSRSFNVFYTGKLFTNYLNQDIDNKIFNNNLLGINKNSLITTENNILAIKKIGKNSINLSLDLNLTDQDVKYYFTSDSIFYNKFLGLDDRYKYKSKHQDQKLSAQLFYLLRLSDQYYLRIGAQSLYEKDNLITNLTPNSHVADFDNDNYVKCLDNNISLKLSKDIGKLTFTTGAALKAVKLENNINRDFKNTPKILLTPMLRMTYKFSNTNFINLNYNEAFVTHSIKDMIDGYYIDSYNRITNSDVNKLYGYVHKAELSHIFMDLLNGFTLINMANFEYKKNNITNDYAMNFIINQTTQRVVSGEKAFTWMTSADQKFMVMPLDIKINLMYTHIYTPFYNKEELLKAKNNVLNTQSLITTHYKKGLNGKLVIDYMMSSYNSSLGKNTLHSTDWLAELSFTAKKLYAAMDMRYRTYRFNGNTTHNTYYDITCRYKITEKMTLQIVGNDVLHLSSRTQTEAVLNSYFTNYRTIDYMPGSIRAGFVIKY